jgi:hypothetical protein
VRARLTCSDVLLTNFAQVPAATAPAWEVRD